MEPGPVLHISVPTEGLNRSPAPASVYSGGVQSQLGSVQPPPKLREQQDVGPPLSTELLQWLLMWQWCCGSSVSQICGLLLHRKQHETQKFRFFRVSLRSVQHFCVSSSHVLFFMNLHLLHRISLWTGFVSGLNFSWTPRVSLGLCVLFSVFILFRNNVFSTKSFFVWINWISAAVV